MGIEDTRTTQQEDYIMPWGGYLDHLYGPGANKRIPQDPAVPPLTDTQRRRHLTNRGERRDGTGAVTAQGIGLDQSAPDQQRGW